MNFNSSAGRDQWLSRRDFTIGQVVVHWTDLAYLAFIVACCLPLVLSNRWLPSLGFFLLPAALVNIRRYRLLALISLMFVGGFYWSMQSINKGIEGVLPKHLEGLELEVTANVVNLPSSKHGTTKFVAELELDDYEKRTIRARLSCYRCAHTIGAGHKWRFTVRLKRPRGYASWGSFDYEKYLFRHGIQATGYVRGKHAMELLSEGSSWNIHRWREGIAAKLKTELNDSVGVDMILALTIGDKSGFTSAQRDIFQQTGVSHLMAISGLHVGLVFGFVYLVANLLLRPFTIIYRYSSRQRYAAGLAFIVAGYYAALAGFAIPTQRALLMLTIILLCRSRARPIKLQRSLVYCVVLLLLLDPLNILDLGFWLSVSAVLIIALSIKEGISVMRQLISVQFKLWLGMMPITFLGFGQISLASPLVNLLFVPMFAYCLVPITLTLTSLKLAMDSNWINHLLTLLASTYDSLFDLLDKVSSLQWVRVYMSESDGLILVVPFFVLVLIWFRKLWPATKRLIRPIPILVLVSICSIALFSYSSREPGLKITLLDVGQGLSMVVHAPNYVMVYDTGAKYLSGFSAADAVLLPYLRREGISFIDDLVISHADNDHIGGLQSVLDNYQTQRRISSRIDRVPEARACEAGMHWRRAEVEFTVLSPETNTPQGSNNRSCVIKIDYRDHSVLITGDIEAPVERFLVQNHSRFLQSTIMLIPHQGSKTSSTQAFLEVVKPKHALVAAGYRNHYRHPHESVMARYRDLGILVHSTIDNGSIELEFLDDKMQITPYRQQRKRPWHY